MMSTPSRKRRQKETGARDPAAGAGAGVAGLALYGLPRLGGATANDGSGEQQWYAECILRARRKAKPAGAPGEFRPHIDTRWEYFVKWAGFDDSENTWEPVQSLKACKDLVRRFWDSVSSRDSLSESPYFRTQAGFVIVAGAEWIADEKLRFAKHISDDEVKLQNADPRRYWQNGTVQLDTDNPHGDDDGDEPGPSLVANTSTTPIETSLDTKTLAAIANSPSPSAIPIYDDNRTTPDEILEQHNAGLQPGPAAISEEMQVETNGIATPIISIPEDYGPLNCTAGVDPPAQTVSALPSTYASSWGIPTLLLSTYDRLSPRSNVNVAARPPDAQPLLNTLETDVEMPPADDAPPGNSASSHAWSFSEDADPGRGEQGAVDVAMGAPATIVVEAEEPPETLMQTETATATSQPRTGEIATNDKDGARPAHLPTPDATPAPSAAQPLPAGLALSTPRPSPAQPIVPLPPPDLRAAPLCAPPPSIPPTTVNTAPPRQPQRPKAPRHGPGIKILALRCGAVGNGTKRRVEEMSYGARGAAVVTGNVEMPIEPRAKRAGGRKPNSPTAPSHAAAAPTGPAISATVGAAEDRGLAQKSDASTATPRKQATAREHCLTAQLGSSCLDPRSAAPSQPLEGHAQETGGGIAASRRKEHTFVDSGLEERSTSMGPNTGNSITGKNTSNNCNKGPPRGGSSAHELNPAPTSAHWPWSLKDFLD
ncbi:Chromo domain-containing protein [Mycena indigotica]|uniref:Chromo domain-containing protein n=1 Tax=Mycena indigotica TaxID=2126181 RepID=A0A8H6VPJ8_9AGAR|nr:Chromo domain-containing protein [Mycena indigotica]KAF7288929.1 Chromo domain-containing protein [Mycena indigotica]